MKRTSVTKNKTLNVWGTALGLALAVIFVSHDATAAQTPVALGSAATFGVLAGPTVTSSGATTVNGDLGVSPGTTVTGAPTVNGTLHLGDAIAAQAQLDLTTAYNDAAGRTVGAVSVAGNLGGQTLTPGLYKSTSSLEISSGDLTLDAQGDTNAVFIFQMASTLVTTSGRQVILSGGAKAANIFWQVGSSATLGTTSTFKGNILALASITVTTGATVEGRLLAQTAAVTLDSNTITSPSKETPVGKITLVSPSGSVAAGSTQRYTWNIDAAATWYELYVLQNGKLLRDQWFTESDSVAQSGSGHFAVDVSGHTGGSYQWWVRGWNPTGMGLWSSLSSEGLVYTMTPPPPPGPVTLLTPANNTYVLMRQPEFTWTASSPTADWYDVYVMREGSKYAEQWVQGATNWMPASGLPGGCYTWYVHPWNAAGYGPWSTGFNFTIPTAVPGAITLVSPSGSVAAGSTQRYTWKIDAAATWYRLYVQQNGSLFRDHWYTLTDSVVDIATGNFAVDVSGHTTGSYQWWVLGWGPDGTGAWSQQPGLTFQVP